VTIAPQSRPDGLVKDVIHDDRASLDDRPERMADTTKRAWGITV
jgi:hypothetical protein